MIKKYKYFLFFVLTALFLPAGFSDARTEINYPTILGVNITTGADLSQYIFYFFQFFIVSAAGIGIISIVISGVQILISFGKPELISSAKSRIFSTMAGIILLATSFLILRTINPELVAPKTSTATLTPGAYIVKPVPVSPNNPEGIIYEPALTSYINTSNIPSGSTFLYYCINPGDTVRVWRYNQPNYIIDRSTNLNNSITDTFDMPCDGLRGFSLDGTGSFFWEKKRVGVYFYLQKDCSGISTCDGIDSQCAMRKSDGIILFDDDVDKDQTVRSVEIVSGTPYSQKYGVILSTYIGGECSQPFINISGSPGALGNKQNCSFVGSSGICCNIANAVNGDDLNPGYAHIIQPSPNPHTGGVKLQSENYQVFLEANKIGLWYSYRGNSVDELLRDPNRQIYTSKSKEEIEESKECEADDPNFPCLKKVLPQSEYYTVLYGHSLFTNEDNFCELFRNPIEDVKFQADVPYGYDLYEIHIIPHAR